MRLRCYHAIPASMLLTAMPATAQDKSPKTAPAHIGKMLDQLKIKYEIDDDKDYSIIFRYNSEDRSQLVFVDAVTETVNETEVRAIFAPAADIKKSPLSSVETTKLLVETGNLKWGQWEVRGNYLYFTIKLVEPIAPKQLEAALKLAAEVADNKEIELSGKKDAY